MLSMYVNKQTNKQETNNIFMQYELETFTEGRKTAWAYEPYAGTTCYNNYRLQEIHRRRKQGGEGAVAPLDFWLN